jgi:hypothetical protein
MHEAKIIVQGSRFDESGSVASLFFVAMLFIKKTKGSQE